MAQAQIKAVITAEDRASSVLTGVGASFGKLAGAMAVGQLAANAVSNAIGAVVSASGNVLKSAADFQQSRVAFDTMLGSAERAKKMLKEISDFAQRTPFELPEVVTGAKQLLAYNIEAEKIIPTFEALGNIAAGVGKDKLPQLILAYGQVRAATKLTGAELRQFTEAGVPLLDTLAKQFGTTAGTIQDMISAGKIKFSDVEKAISGMSGEGGKFFNLMDKQSKTFDGVLSNLNDNFMRVGRNMIGLTDEGDVVQGGIFYYLTQGAQKLLDWIDTHRDSIIGFFNAEILPSITALGEKIAAFVSSDQFKNWLRDIADWLANKLPPFLEKLVNEYLPAMKTAFDNVWPVIKFTSEAIGGLVWWFGEAGKGAEKFGYDVMNAFYAARDAFNAVVGFFAGIGSSIIGAVSGAANWLYNVGKDIVQGLLNGINALGGKIGDTLKGWAKSGVDAVKNVLGIHSPSTVFAGIGENIGQGLEQGIVSSVGAASDTLNGMVSSPSVDINRTNSQTPVGQFAPSSQSTNTTVNMNLNIGMYAGGEIEKRKVAMEIWSSLQEVANQKNTTISAMMGA